MAGTIGALLGIWPVSADASATTGVMKAQAAKEVSKGQAQAAERAAPAWEKGLVEPITGRIEHFRPEEKIGLHKALSAGKSRDLMEEMSRRRGRVIRGQAQPQTLLDGVARMRGRVADHGASGQRQGNQPSS